MDVICFTDHTKIPFFYVDNLHVEDNMYNA